MAQAIGETVFDVFYLCFALVSGLTMLLRGRTLLVKRAGAMWALAAVRIGLCLLPQNRWLEYRQPLFWGVLRNIPFAVMGVLIILLFAREVRRTGDPVFRFMPLAVGLSFGSYLPVVLFSGVAPAVGMLMIPKTLAYVWVVVMCRTLYRREKKA